MEDTRKHADDGRDDALEDLEDRADQVTDAFDDGRHDECFLANWAQSTLKDVGSRVICCFRAIVTRTRNEETDLALRIFFTRQRSEGKMANTAGSHDLLLVHSLLLLATSGSTPLPARKGHRFAPLAFPPVRTATP